MVPKDKFDEQRESYQGGAFHILFVVRNEKWFAIHFLVTSVKKNVAAKFSGLMYMFQKYFQLDTISLASWSCRNCFHITIPDNYKLWTFYYYVTSCAVMGSGSNRAPVDVSNSCKIPCSRPFWINYYHHVKMILFHILGWLWCPYRWSIMIQVQNTRVMWSRISKLILVRR